MTRTIGWYYLHESGDLIYKPSPDAIMDIRDSDFAKAVWPYDPSNRGNAWRILVEASAIGAKKDRVFELAKKWGCDDADAQTYCERIGAVIERDGSGWFAHTKNFINIQESKVGFGETPLEALANLCGDLCFQPTKLNWHNTFHDLISEDNKNEASQTVD